MIKTLTSVGDRVPTVMIDIFKGSPDPSHFIFEINVGRERIRHTTPLKLNNEFIDQLEIN